MNKAYKNHKLLLVTEFIFCDDPNANGNVLLDFCRGKRSDADFRVGLQRYPVPAALYATDVGEIHTNELENVSTVSNNEHSYASASVRMKTLPFMISATCLTNQNPEFVLFVWRITVKSMVCLFFFVYLRHVFLSLLV